MDTSEQTVFTDNTPPQSTINKDLLALVTNMSGIPSTASPGTSFSSSPVARIKPLQVTETSQSTADSSPDSESSQDEEDSNVDSSQEVHLTGEGNFEKNISQHFFVQMIRNTFFVYMSNIYIISMYIYICNRFIVKIKQVFVL